MLSLKYPVIGEAGNQLMLTRDHGSNFPDEHFLRIVRTLIRAAEANPGDEFSLTIKYTATD